MTSDEIFQSRPDRRFRTAAGRLLRVDVDRLDEAVDRPGI